MTEAYSTLNNTIRYYGRAENGKIVEKGAQIPFNFQLMGTNFSTTAVEFKKLITGFIKRLPKGEKIEANWVVSEIFQYFFQNIFDFFLSLQVGKS